MKHSLQLKLSQHLTLTPQLQQSIRLLQLSTLELNQEIETFLQENPLLERDEEEEEAATVPIINSALPATSPAPTESAPAPAETGSSDERAIDDGYGSFSGQDADDEADPPQIAAEPAKLRDHLFGQINIMQMPDRDKRIVAYLIDNLDDDGFMTQDLAELAALLPTELEIGEEDLTIALKYLQSLDPPGVGARSLSESLSLQLEALPEHTLYRTEALQIVTQHLDTFAARDYFRLKKLLRCDDDTLRGIQSLIIGLNPRPAASFSHGETRYVIPDVVVRKINGLPMKSRGSATARSRFPPWTTQQIAPQRRRM